MGSTTRAQRNVNKQHYHCWITNLTKLKLRIPDLNVRLQPFATLDILDYKHSDLTVEEVNQSIEKGDAGKLKAQNKISFRQSEPKPYEKQLFAIEMKQIIYPYKYRDFVPIEEKIFEELESVIDVVNFSNFNADMAEIEHEPAINLRKIAKELNEKSGEDKDANSDE